MDNYGISAQRTGVMDGSGRCARAYGSEGRARCVPDEVVDRGLPRPLPDNTTGIATCLDARRPGPRGDL